MLLGVVLQLLTSDMREQSAPVPSGGNMLIIILKYLL